MKEAVIEMYLKTQVKLRKGDVRKVQWLGRRGAPDRLVMFPGGKHYFVELKAPGKKAEPHQVREHKRLQRYGFKVFVIDTREQVDAFVERYA